MSKNRPYTCMGSVMVEAFSERDLYQTRQTKGRERESLEGEIGLKPNLHSQQPEADTRCIVSLMLRCVNVL